MLQKESMQMRKRVTAFVPTQLTEMCVENEDSGLKQQHSIMCPPYSIESATPRPFSIRTSNQQPWMTVHEIH